MRHALFAAPFGELADPRHLAELAGVAEQSGWDGLFLWDHMWRPPSRADRVGDATVALAAVAAATSTLRLGPMVVPLARRRPQKVARETVALDLLSGGRLIVGVGLGVNTDGELARFGEVDDDRRRGDVLDEALEVLLGLWSGATVSFRGPHFVADGVAFHPTPLQQPRIPLWGAARPGAARPLRRAARLDGLFPVGVTRDQLRAMVDAIARHRGDLTGFDVAVLATPELDAAAAADAGATWLLAGLAESPTMREATELASGGPRA